MEIRQDQHQEMFTPSLREDFRDDEDDDEDNRFIICLDDVEMKDDSLDECDKSPEEVEGNDQVSSNVPSLHFHASSLYGAGNKIQFEDRPLEEKSLKSLSESREIHQSNQTISSMTDPHGAKTKCPEEEFPHLDSEDRSAKEISMERNERTKAESQKELRNSVAQHDIRTVDISKQKCVVDHQNDSNTLQAIGTENRPKVTVSKFNPHKDCSCIMCYPGRGILDSNWIPTAAKRKSDALIEDSLAKSVKMTSRVIPRHSDKVFSRSQNASQGKNPLSLPSGVTSGDRPMTESLISRPMISKDMSLSNSSNVSSLASPSIQNSSYVYLVPHAPSVSLAKKNDVSRTSQEQSNMYSSSSRVVSSSVLPFLTPNPHICSSIPNAIPALSPGVAHVSSHTNFSLVSQASLMNTFPKTQVKTSQSDKTHIVLIDKSSAEKQLTDLSGIINKATKVDMSHPGVVRVHYIPALCQVPVSNVSQKLKVSMPQKNPQVFPSSVASYALENGVEHTLLGLVKHHLVKSSSSSKKAHHGQNASLQSLAAKSSQSSMRRLPFHPNTSVAYSLISKGVIPDKSAESTGSLPPPPPLTPMPQPGTSLKPRNYQAVEVVDLEEETTETMVLPLPKHDQQKTSDDISLNSSRHNDRLLSPSLFTFSPPLESSPQKSASQYSSPFHQNQIYLGNSSVCPITTTPCPTISSTSSTPTTSMSYSVSQQNAFQCTSSWSSSSPLVSQTGHTGISNTYSKQENISRWHQPQTSSHCSSMSTTSQPSASIVSNVTGLKMKIRLKDNKSEDTNISISSLDWQSSSKFGKISKPSTEGRKHDAVVLSGSSSNKGHSQPVADKAVSKANSSNENNTAAPYTLPGRTETAEEMFQRFQDQAMREVYNAQFGVGKVHRNLRPVRTTFATIDDPVLQSKISEELKSKKADMNKSKPNQSDANQTGCISDGGKKVVKNRKRRSLSGEARQKFPAPAEKSMKLDIDQYPKLMQDNSIVNSKTIYTPNILAGHKVYVKFNVFSNNQSGRCFLAPFFNIGGSRTQFDVEDMEYFNKAVVDFEKEERSCARHLLYYSRDGNKATFLRKEHALHCNELSTKSYRKQSYILQGYTIEKPKKPTPPSDEWKLDRIVAIEMDRAEEDCNIELPQDQKGREDLPQDQEPTEVYIDHADKENEVMSLNDHADAVDLNEETIDKHRLKSNDNCASPLGLFPDTDTSVNTHNMNFQSDTISGFNSFKFACHRDKINILKRNSKVRHKALSSVFSSPKNSPLKPKFDYIKQREELLVKDNVNENMSSAISETSHSKLDNASTLNEQVSCRKYDHTDEQIHNIASVTHIKAEVQDDGYDSALMVREHKEPPLSQDPVKVSIKSEPLDDYTESLAQSMNLSLKSNEKTCSSSLKLKSTKAQDSDQFSLSESDNFATPEVEVDLSDSLKAVSSKEEASTVTDAGIDCSIPPETVGIIKSEFPEKDSCTSSVVDAESHQSCNIESKRRSAEPESSSLSESDEVASSSENGTWSDDGEIEEATLTASLTSSGCLKIPTANNKITSLVESLKQRLVQNNSSFPPLFPAPESVENTKKRKKKKRKRPKLIMPNPKENPSHCISILVNKSQNSPSHSIITDGVGEFENGNHSAMTGKGSKEPPSTQDMSGIIIKSEPIDDYTESSLVPLKSSSLIKLASSSQFSSPEENPQQLKSGVEENRLTMKCTRQGNCSSSSEMSTKTCTSAKSIGETTSPASTVMVGKVSKIVDNQVKKNGVQIPITIKSEHEIGEVNVVDQEINQLTKNKIVDESLHRKNGDREKDKLLSSNASKEGSIGAHLELRYNSSVKSKESEFAPDQDAHSNCSTPCSDIDVGTEEVTFDISAHCPTARSFLANTLVSSIGQAPIKDFTREHDLMLPFAGTKPPFNSGKSIQRNAHRKKFSVTNLPMNRKDSDNNGVIKTHPKIAKVPNENSHQAECKPSIASLLCEKLAIDADPASPTPSLKKSKLAPATTPNPGASTPTPGARTKRLTSQEESSSYPVSSSFYKPTLSAIFGVENVTIPVISASSSTPEVEGKEPSPFKTQGKRRKQVALKGLHNRKKTFENLRKPQLLKPKSSPKENSQKVKVNLTPASQKDRCKDQAKAGHPQIRPTSQSHPRIRSTPQKRTVVSLQSVFRTWRQLSHDERNKQKEAFNSPANNFGIIPCKVVLNKIQLDSNGQLIKSKSDKEEEEGTADSMEDRMKKSAMARRKRRKAAAKGKRRRTPRGKVDIVDYYTSMLENLRKKAQMLEEETKRKQEEKEEKKESEIEMKTEPIVFEESRALTFHTKQDDTFVKQDLPLDPSSFDDIKICVETTGNERNEAKENGQNEFKTKLPPTQEETALIESDQDFKLAKSDQDSLSADKSSPSHLLTVCPMSNDVSKDNQNIEKSKNPSDQVDVTIPTKVSESVNEINPTVPIEVIEKIDDICDEAESDYVLSDQIATIAEDSLGESEDDKNDKEDLPEQMANHINESEMSTPADGKNKMDNVVDDKDKIKMNDPVDDKDKMDDPVDDKDKMDDPVDYENKMYDPVDDKDKMDDPTDDKNKMDGYADDKNEMDNPVDDKNMMDGYADDKNEMDNPVDVKNMMDDPSDDKNMVDDSADDKNEMDDSADDMNKLNDPADNKNESDDPAVNEIKNKAYVSADEKNKIDGDSPSQQSNSVLMPRDEDDSASQHLDSITISKITKDEKDDSIDRPNAKERLPSPNYQILERSKNAESDQTLQRQPSSLVHDNFNETLISSSQLSTSRSTSVTPRKTLHSSVEDANMSDSSEAGDLVIDYESEPDVNKSSQDLLVEGEAKESMSDSVQRSHDVADLISDSSFRTKDIVLGFENELGADTVISTLSQGDMEDLFLLEDGEEDSQMGMISDEEVERLLGLDVAGKDEIESSIGSKQHKSDVTKMLSSSEKSDSSTLHWVTLPENSKEGTKEKVHVDFNENSQMVCVEDPLNSLNRESETGKSWKDNSCNNNQSESESHLQVKEKKTQVSPSWNRLLGSEALKKMKDDVSKPSSCPQPSSSKQSKLSQPDGHMKLKFNAGALSKALKLSAEMKKVFAEGPSHSSLSQKWTTTTTRSTTVQATTTKQCIKAVAQMDMSNVKMKAVEKEKNSSDKALKQWEDSSQVIIGSGPTDNRVKNCVQYLKQPCDKPNMEISLNIGHAAEANRKSSVSKCFEAIHHNANNTESNKLTEITVTDESDHATQMQTRRSSKCKAKSGIGIKIKSQEPALYQLDSSHSSTALQSSSSSAEGNSKGPPQSAVLTTGPKGIDIKKLKLKLNLVTNKKDIPTATKTVSNDAGTPLPIPIRTAENNLQKKALHCKTRGQGDVDSPDSSLRLRAVQKSVEKLPVRKNENSVETSNIRDKKQTARSEPMLNTAKLCNILKNLKKPSSGFTVTKSKTSDSSSSSSSTSGVSLCRRKSSMDQNNSNGTSRRRLRSSPRRECVENEKSGDDSGKETVNGSELPRFEEQSEMRKVEDEDKAGRSFIDCLSDVISSGAWEET